jgi:hypothetical protein
MLEFLTSNFNFIIYGFELLAALVGILCLVKFRNTTTQYFIYFLIYVVFVEFIGASLVYFPKFTAVSMIRSIGIRAINWYNLFWFFGSILFVLFYFHSLIKLKPFKVIIKGVSVFFTLIMLVHFILYFEIFMNSHPKIYQFLGLFATFICISLYFIEFLKSDYILHIFKTFGFYASVGLLLWWLIITPVIFFDDYNTVSDWDFANLKRLIFLLANIFMYSCFTIGLIISKPKND